MTAEAIDEVQTMNIRSGSDDRMVVRSHFVEPGPGATWINARFREYRNTRSGMRENLFNEGRIELSFESGGLFRIVPGQQDAFAFSSKVKPGGHIDDHREA